MASAQSFMSATDVDDRLGRWRGTAVDPTRATRHALGPGAAMPGTLHLEPSRPLRVVVGDDHRAPLAPADGHAVEVAGAFGRPLVHATIVRRITLSSLPMTVRGSGSSVTTTMRGCL